MTIALVDERMSEEAKRRLQALGFYTVETRAFSALPAPLAAHPDMLLFHHGGTVIAPGAYIDSAPYIFEDIMRLAAGLSLRATDEVQGDKYPRDAIFNALAVGDKIFLKSDSVSRALEEYAVEAGLKIINVRQGYPACTVLALGAYHAITADEGMAAAMEAEGISVLRISNGGISLPPYEYGFIGGAAGVFRDRVYFIGDLASHPDGEAIDAFCRSAGFVPVSLARHPLSDLGRIIFIDDGI